MSNEEPKTQNWDSDLARELRERRKLLEEAQRFYYEQRKQGRSHALAFAVVIEELVSYLKKVS